MGGKKKNKKKAKAPSDDSNLEIQPIEENLIICKICMNNYDLENHYPKKLACPHVFCRSCIDRFLVTGSRFNKKITCPICRQKTPYDNDGTLILEVNGKLIDLVAMIKGYVLRKDKERINKYFGDSNVENTPDEHDRYLDLYNVAVNQRVVVKSANPILHPLPNLDVDYDTCNSDDDEGNGGKNENSTESETKLKLKGTEINGIECMHPKSNSIQNIQDAPCTSIIEEQSDKIISYPNKTLQNIISGKSLQVNPLIQENSSLELMRGTKKIDQCPQMINFNGSDALCKFNAPSSVNAPSSAIRHVEEKTNYYDQNDTRLTKMNDCIGKGTVKSDYSKSSGRTGSLSPGQRGNVPNHSPFTANPAYSEMNFGDDSDDIDWNYFTQTSSNFGETLRGDNRNNVKSNGSSISGNNGNEITRVNGFVYNASPPVISQISERNSENPSSGYGVLPLPPYSATTQEITTREADTDNIAVTLPKFHESTIFEGYVDSDIVFPAEIKTSADGKIVLICGNNSKGDNISSVQLLNDKGDKLQTVSLPKAVNDVCILNQDSNKLATASTNGIDIYDLSNSIPEPVKTIPLGFTQCVAAFKNGFVVASADSINVCPDLNSTLLFYTLKQTRPAFATFTGIKQLDTCVGRQEIIVVKTTGACLAIDGNGNILEKYPIKIDKENSGMEKLISLNPRGTKLMMIDIEKQILELHDVALSSGNKNPLAFSLASLNGMMFPAEKVLGGTMVGNNKIFLLYKGVDGDKIRMYKLM